MKKEIIIFLHENLKNLHLRNFKFWGEMSHKGREESGFFSTEMFFSVFQKKIIFQTTNDQTTPK